ncbi:RluA family pseudouridine synthase [Aestuariirhabdus litorea]|uniref:Dual-specificity RNA pseudouridine synthase RluA n=1 Tax=Aestuariirhabdus litorea TaxID=2528527 RepID=A0A3P3VVE0_9GAMM|nr:RluA family pseudouridine synthase [Aestuariirhabdus litorea]RRJ85419.1 RluA family pseudouridine synthase [Aestuariirhabdus litorea]RWW97253.1 RluA family pseudouridine synthase [Endozoicomonadaceae bacterium GTF-13]
MSHTPDYYIAPPCHEPLQILRETAGFWVVSKPSGLLSVPGRAPENQDSVITRLQALSGEAWAVHRLDMDTSGLLVVARNKASLSALSRQFQQRSVSKLYQALVFGLPEAEEGTIELPLICDWPNRPRQKVDWQQGKPSLTHWRVLARDPGRHCSLLALTPVTGRSHQLRVHLAEIGHPILGCRFYGHGDSIAAAERLMLHAGQLAFDDPEQGGRVETHCDSGFGDRLAS